MKIIISYKILLFNFLTIFFLIITLSSFAQEADSVGYLVKVGEKAPDFDFQYADGSKAKLSDYEGRVIMLQFTASWCKVCREEMPHIEKEIWQQYKDKGLILIGIDRDEPADKVIEFARKMKITYPLALDPGADIFGLYSLKESGVTRNVIIDRTGQIVFLTRLFKMDEFLRMKEKIGELLDE